MNVYMYMYCIVWYALHCINTYVHVLYSCIICAYMYVYVLYVLYNTHIYVLYYCVVWAYVCMYVLCIYMCMIHVHVYVCIALYHTTQPHYMNMLHTSARRNMPLHTSERGVYLLLHVWTPGNGHHAHTTPVTLHTRTHTPLPPPYGTGTTHNSQPTTLCNYYILYTKYIAKLLPDRAYPYIFFDKKVILTC